MAKKNKEMEVAVAEVVDYLRLNGQFAPALKEVVMRKLASEAAREKGFKVTTAQLQRAADTFRAAQGLHKASDTKQWLSANGLTLDALEEYLTTNLLISKFKEHLGKNSNTRKYLASELVKDTVNELIYQDWMDRALKQK